MHLSVRTTMTLTDKMTGTLQKMMKAMNSTIRAMEQMHNTSSRSMDMRSLQRARRDIESATTAINRLRTSARLAQQNVGALGDKFRGTSGGIAAATNGVGRFLSKFTGFAAAILSVQALTEGFKKLVSASDAYSNVNARLANINDGSQTQKELQDKIYRAAQRSLGSYNDMAASVSKLNLLAGDAFSSNNEAIRFAELMNKSFAVSGAGAQEKAAGMHQLTQALASGRLQGDEFVSITENAPLLAKAIANAMGVSMGEMKKLSSEGKITADIIKKSLFEAANDIEDKFSKLPLTFADAMTVFNNWAQRAFEPLFIRLRQFVNSKAFGVLAGHAMVFINLFVAGLSLVFDALETLYTIIGAVGQFMYDNASWVVPVLVVIGTVIGSIVAILAGKYTVLGLIRVATMAWAAAQWVVNAAYLASPITWVLIAIIAVIAFVVMAMVMWGEQTATVIGFVAGIFGALGAFIFNTFANIANFLTTFAEFFINLFIDPVYAVKKLFYDLVRMVVDNMSAMMGSFDNAATFLGNAFVAGANKAIKAINWISDAIKSVTGIDLGKFSELGMTDSKMISKYIQNFAIKPPTSDKNVVSLPKTKLMNIPNAFDKANEWAYNGMIAGSEKLGGLVEKAKNVMGLGEKKEKENPFLDKFSLMDDVVNTAPSASKIGASGDPDKGKRKDGKLKGGKLDKVGKIEDKVNLADEYLELFKDIAEGKAIHNIVSLTPHVQVYNHFDDTTGSAMEKMLTKFGDLSNTNGNVAKINDYVSQALNASVRDDVTVSNEVREKVSASPITNNSKTIVQHIQSEPKFYFTGDIHEKVDVNDVIKVITQGLKEEQSRSVEGVYG
ncbi:tape measure protein [Lysinibacillus sphaericus]|uniref:tape measure protein n=1 Tax=Lysinibacillus sphaericus TaxID=1421 RepID=UPI001E50D39B|nr:tape measure protein [Lysinibacillus sphaericus]